jgi:hypothetical protein
MALISKSSALGDIGEAKFGVAQKRFSDLNPLPRAPAVR